MTIYYLHQKGIFAQLLLETQDDFDPSSMFADDVAFLCRQTDLEKILSALEDCGTYTGLQLNLVKTVVFDPIMDKVLPSGVVITSGLVKYLGAYLGTDESVETKNFDIIKRKMKIKIDRWNH